MAILLHITDHSSWERARVTGWLRPESLASEGFIHCSTVRQVVDTANLFFASREDLLLVCIDEARIGAEVKYEAPSGNLHDPALGALFPHIYGALNLDAVVDVVPFHAGADGAFVLPEAVHTLVQQHSSGGC